MASAAPNLRRSLGLAPIAWFAIVLYAAFLVYPLLQSVYLSFTNKSPLLASSQFVGLKNYIALFSDAELWQALAFTGITVVSVTVVANAAGLSLALLYNRQRGHYKVMRTLVFIPQVLSGVIVAFIWKSILTEGGLLNSTLLRIGIIHQPVDWLGTSTLASVSVCLVVTWITIGFATVVYTASLQSVPPELYEAARMDGAGTFRRFSSVTFPMIAPGMTISVVLSLITTFKLYDVVAVLTGGGPAGSTQTAAFYLIKQAFTDNKFGYSSAIAIFVLILTSAVAYLVTSLLRRRETEL